MKKLFLFIAVVSGLTACKKEIKSIYTFEDKTNKAKIKVVHVVPNAFRTAKDTAAQAGMQLYFNGAKLTGATNNTYGGGVFPSLEYSMVNAGTSTLQAIIPATDTTAAVTVVNASVNLENHKTYTLFMLDSLPTTSVLQVEEDFSDKADSGKYFIRLVNATLGAPSLDLFGTTDVATVVDSVNYKTASNYVQLPVGSGLRAFALRSTGSTTNLVTVSFTPIAGRMYTFFTYGVIGKGGARVPRITFYTGRFQTAEF